MILWVYIIIFSLLNYDDMALFLNFLIFFPAHTLTFYHIALAYILKRGTEREIQEIGLTVQDLDKLQVEAAQILEFYSDDNPFDQNCIKLMTMVRGYLNPAAAAAAE